MLEDMGVATGIDLDASIRAAAVAEEIVGHTVPSNLLRAGDRKR
jgi:hydroxymethylglutaryl-CoA lyase